MPGEEDPGRPLADVSLTGHLARRPVEERKAVVDDLSRRMGNRQVARMVRAAAAAEAADPPAEPPE